MTDGLKKESGGKALDNRSQRRRHRMKKWLLSWPLYFFVSDFSVLWLPLDSLFWTLYLTKTFLISYFLSLSPALIWLFHSFIPELLLSSWGRFIKCIMLWRYFRDLKMSSFAHQSLSAKVMIMQSTCLQLNQFGFSHSVFIICINLCILNIIYSFLCIYNQP